MLNCFVFGFLRSDFKRILLKPKNLLLITAIAAMFTYADDTDMDLGILMWLVFITINISLISAILTAAACTSSDSFCDDMEHNYGRQIILRIGCFWYSVVRIFTSFFSVLIVFMGGYLLSVLVRLCRYGMPSGESISFAKEMYDDTMYSEVLIEHGWFWYGVCIGLHIAVLAGIMSLWGLLLSLYINNRMLVYLMPVAFLNVLDMFLQRFLGVSNGSGLSLYAMGITGLTFPRTNMSPGRYYLLVMVNIIIVSVLIYKKMEKEVRLIGQA